MARMHVPPPTRVICAQCTVHCRLVRGMCCCSLGRRGRLLHCVKHFMGSQCKQFARALHCLVTPVRMVCVVFSATFCNGISLWKTLFQKMNLCSQTFASDANESCLNRNVWVKARERTRPH